MLNVIDIYNYFSQHIKEPKTVLGMLEELCRDELILSKGDDVSIMNFGLVTETDHICSKMCQDDFLIKVKSDVFVGNNKYIGVDARERKSIEALSDQSFDCKYRGFPYIRNLCLNAVRPIVGINLNDNPDIGTVFKIADNVYVTAKHCITDLQSFNILDEDEKSIPIREIVFPQNENIDIALVYTENIVSGRSFPMMMPAILEDVLVMGYPPISGMYPVLISEKGQVSAVMKSSLGTNVGETKDYLKNLDCFLISARVKGGSSGSPVVNRYGMCCGIVVSLPSDFKKPERVDLMGYGACLPSSYIESLLKGEDVVKMPIKMDKELCILVS